MTHQQEVDDVIVRVGELRTDVKALVRNADKPGMGVFVADEIEVLLGRVERLLESPDGRRVWR